MTQVYSSSAAISKFRPGLSVRLAVLGSLFIAEKIFLNIFVDFDRAQDAQGLGAFVRVAQHWGFRFLVAVAAGVALFAFVRGAQNTNSAALAVRAAPLRFGWWLLHFLLIAILAPLSYLLYRYTASNLSFAVVATLWSVTSVATALAALVAMAPLSLWLDAARALGSVWWYAMVAALLGTGAMQFAQKLWEPTAALTFDLARRILSPVVPTLTADTSTLVLSTGHFAVQIADLCSGLEGVGLVLAFTGAWLFYFRDEYIFPQALLLIPAGVVTIFALNVLRIAVLILIGDAGFPDIAVYGFHSQAGWIAFIAVACGLVLVSRRNPWLNRTAKLPDAALVIRNPTAVYLMPLLAILAAGTVSGAFSSDFEFFYPLRVIVGLMILARYRRELAAIDWSCSWRGPTVGVFVFIVWIVAALILLPVRATPPQLAAMPITVSGLWIVSRLVGSIVLVPIAEELAYRGYLMRRLINADFESVSFRSVRWPALTITAIVFGLAHGALWLPGVMAGLAYGWIVVRHGRMGEAFAAHATTNALIAITVLAGEQWQLW